MHNHKKSESKLVIFRAFLFIFFRPLKISLTRNKQLTGRFQSFLESFLYLQKTSWLLLKAANSLGLANRLFL